MTYWTLKNLDKGKIRNSNIVGFTLSEFLLTLHLDSKEKIEISDYWELVDAGEPIDRALANANRQHCYLFKLIGRKVVSFDKQLSTFIIHFDNDISLKMLVAADNLDTQYYKPFGDNFAGPPAI